LTSRFVCVSFFVLSCQLWFASGAIAPPCDPQRKDVCDDFCNYRCGFYNSSLGETGGIENVTVYRITPSNLTGIKNKDTGDAPGDVGFFLSKKNLAAQCAKDPTSFGCFLDGDDIYGRFVVEMDTSFGPYFECNPVNMGEDTHKHVAWTDTRSFMCGQGCLNPTPTGCHGYHDDKKKNGTNEFGGVQCFCDGTARHNLTVGREDMPYTDPWYLGPDYWQPQCKTSYYEYYNKQTKQYGGCLNGQSYKTVTAWPGADFAALTAKACDLCSSDQKCTGWRTTDNITVTLFTGHLSKSTDACIGGEKWIDPHGGGSWGSAGMFGGYWYSTTVTAECAPGMPLGTNGCSWRVVDSTYRNASCVDGLVDTAVEEHGEVCFSQCAQPLDRVGACYLQCYKNTLLGDAGYNITNMRQAEVIGPWTQGFTDGGCPVAVPLPCSGPQCP